MEPLVIVSAVVVLFFGYRTVIEEITEMGNDGCWKCLREEVRSSLTVLSQLIRRLSGSWDQKLEYYNNFFGSFQQPRRNLSHSSRPHGIATSSRALAKDAA